MNYPLIFVVSLLGICVAMFIMGRPRMDVVALIALTGLSLSGIVTTKEALEGFGDPSIILIAAMFVLGEGLVRTGIAYKIGDWLMAKAGGSETRLIALLMLAVAGLGSVMSSTGVVAIFIPIALSTSRRMKVHPGKLMMPLSFGGLISGMLTLVATPPNMVVDSYLEREGAKGFSFFTPTPIGLVVLVMGVGYMLLARKGLGVASSTGSSEEGVRTFENLIEEYHLAERAHRVSVRVGSPLAGQKLRELDLRQKFGLNLIAIERVGSWGPELINPSADTELCAGDTLFLDRYEKRQEMEAMSPAQAQALLNEQKVERLPLAGHYFSDYSRQIGMAEVLIPPDSRLLGKSVQDNAFRRRFHVHVIGLRRSGVPMEKGHLDAPLKLGDVLLVIGPWKSILRLQSRKQDLLVLSLPAEAADVVAAGGRATPAILSVVATVGLMITGLVPNVIAGLIGCLLMGAFRCIDLTSAYRSIHWQSLILIAGMMPFAPALEKTGAVNLAVDGMLSVLGNASPHLVLASLFLLTTVMGLFISNTVTAVLMAPIAFSIAQHLHASPLPFALVVAVAASAAFITPVSSPVNTLVYGPGQYRFNDFVKIGLPFTLLVMLATILLVPLLHPFWP